MRDSGGETLQQKRRRRKNDKYAREQFLDGQYLMLDEESIPWILNHIDCFVRQCRKNSNIESVYLFPYAFNGHDHDDEVWDKLAQAIGNPRDLDLVERFRISTYGRPRSRTHDCHENEVAVPIPNWERLARIISHVQQRKIELDDSPWAVDEMQAFCRAIRGHPAITHFRSSYNVPYESLDLLYSVLATLPALRSVKLSNSEQQARPEDEYTTMTHHESLPLYERTFDESSQPISILYSRLLLSLFFAIYKR
jgi:hypothetical protein